MRQSAAAIRKRLARLKEAIDRHWQPSDFDHRRATGEQMVLAVAAADQQIADVFGMCFAEHPQGTWLGPTWPGTSGQHCTLLEYVAEHPTYAGRWAAYVQRMFAEVEADLFGSNNTTKPTCR